MADLDAIITRGDRIHRNRRLGDKRTRHGKMARAEQRTSESPIGTLDSYVAIDSFLQTGHTNPFLIDVLDIEPEDVNYIIAAYGNRVSPVTDEEIDLVKEAINYFFIEKDVNRIQYPSIRHGSNEIQQKERNIRNIRRDFFAYLEVLYSTWGEHRETTANGLLAIGNPGKIMFEAQRHYKAITALLDNDDARSRIKNPNTLVALQSARYIFEKYVLGKEVQAPGMVFVYGASPSGTLGDALIAKGMKLNKST